MIGVLSLGGYNDIFGVTARNNYKTDYSTSYFYNTIPMYVSMQPMTGSYADGPDSATYAHFFTATGYTFELDCSGHATASGQVTDYPVYMNGKDIDGGSGGFKQSFVGITNQFETIINNGNADNSTYEFKFDGYTSYGWAEEDHYDSASPYKSLLHSSSFFSEKMTSRRETRGTDVSTYLTRNISSGGLLFTCVNNISLTNVSVETGTETVYTGSIESDTFFNRNQYPVTNYIEKVTAIDASFTNTTSYYGGMSVSFSSSNLSGLNFKQDYVYTENTSSTFSTFDSFEISGNDSYLDVSYAEDHLNLGAYFDTHYVIGTCETVYTATWQRNASGETNLFKNIFDNAKAGFIVKGDSIKKQVIRESITSSYKPLNNSGEEVGLTYSTRGQTLYNAAYYNNEGDFFKPEAVFFTPRFSYKQMSGIPTQMYKAYSDLSKNREEGLYETYSIRVNKTLNSGLYSNEYNSRKSGITASVGASDANIIQVATVNSNDELMMKKSVNLFPYVETQALPQPWGGNNYFFTDPTTVFFESGAYSYTLHDMSNRNNDREESFIDGKLFEVSNNNILSVETICVVMFGGEPAGAANNLVAISQSNCNNADPSQFNNEMATFNAKNFAYVDRKTEQTFYPVTPGFII